MGKAHHAVMGGLLHRLASKMPPDVYVFGGKDDASPALATVEQLSLDTREWQALPSMPTPRYGCAAAALAGWLYVVGGHDGKNTLAVAERFDIVAGTWEILEPMSTARSRCSAATAQGMLYVVGGNPRNQSTS